MDRLTISPGRRPQSYDSRNDWCGVEKKENTKKLCENQDFNLLSVNVTLRSLYFNFIPTIDLPTEPFLRLHCTMTANLSTNRKHVSVSYIRLGYSVDPCTRYYYIRFGANIEILIYCQLNSDSSNVV